MSHQRVDITDTKILSCVLTELLLILQGLASLLIYWALSVDIVTIPTGIFFIIPGFILLFKGLCFNRNERVELDTIVDSTSIILCGLCHILISRNIYNVYVKIGCLCVSGLVLFIF